MVPPKRTPGDTMNGSGKRDSTSMASQRKDSADSRVGGSARPQNGARSGFRTDTAISNNRAGAERTLRRWVADVPAELDGGLESTPSTGKWDQFAENERLFGVKTDYNENFYTTAIDRHHPQYADRLAVAERAAREIETSTATTSHVAEERVMDFEGGDDPGADEEDKYSGVRRQQDFPPLSSARDNKYTPPARRAPTGHSTVVGAPVDPAIISAQIKGGPRKQQASKPEELKPIPTNVNRPSSAVATPQAKTPEPKTSEKPSDSKQSDTNTSGSAKDTTEPAKSAANTRSSSKPGTPAVSGTSSLRASATPGRASLSPSAKVTASTTSSSAANSPAPPSVTENVENALLKDFKDFASQQRLHAEKARHNKMKADAQVKLQELKKFANSFKLSTPVPSDLISIIAKDPAKQKQIQEKALLNAEELAKTKADVSKTKKSSVSSASSGKAPAPATPSVTAPASTTTSTPAPIPVPLPSTAPAASGPADNAKPANNSRPQGPVHAPHSAAPSGVPNRHTNARGPYMQQNYRQQSQPYRGDRSGPQHMAQGHNTGHLAERIRNSDQNQNRYNKTPSNHGPSHFAASGDVRAPPTGPASSVDAGYSRRLSAIPAGAHMAQKLNPTTHEFRPSPFAASFNPTGPSAGSSPRSTINHMSSDHTATMSSASTTAPAIPSPRAAGGVLIRRKTQNVTSEKCDILTQVKTVKPPQGRNWDDNDGLRPSYDTPLVWRQMQDDEKSDSTMRLKYDEYFERLAFAAASMATPIQGHVIPHGMPQMAHQHQLPLHLQQHGGHMGPRPTPHMQPISMHAGAGGPHGHVPHVSFNGSDDHRMMPSNSAQSYASPRLAQVPMYPQQVGSTPQMAYNQPVMQQFMPNGPQMNQFRSYSNNPQQFMNPQSGPMMPMMAPQHFVAVPGGIMATSQQMPVYAGGPQFMGPPGAPGAGAGGVPPPQQMGGSNGYPSPSRPVAAPLMVQQGSQQGQPMYGMSPSMQYQQPAFGPQHPGQGAKLAMRGGYNNPGSQQYGTSPQNIHQYGPPHRNGSGNYSGKNYQGHNHNSHQGPPPHQAGHAGPPPAGHQSRQAGGDNVEEAK